MMRMLIIALFVVATGCWAKRNLATRNRHILIHGARSAQQGLNAFPAITQVGSSAGQPMSAEAELC